ncbi:MAG: hydroxyacylglutathione hydrolase C-terminal domain-containing protein [Rhodocyclaceae bacterium]
MVEPDNTALAAYAMHCAELREQGRPTLPARLETELAINPFLRTAESAVQASVSQHAGQQIQSPPAVFAALRAWKDVA